MAGTLVPLVVVPRYTSFVRFGYFTTVPVDVTAFQRLILTAWRGKMQGGPSPSFGLSCQESTDRVTWFDCAGTNVSGYDPAASASVEGEGVILATLTRRWFRMRIALGDNSGQVRVTTWVAGHGERRVE
jgi:hypothetical protein